MSPPSRIAALALALAGAAGARAEAGDAPRAYVFAVVPQAPPERIRAIWLPIVERLSAETKVSLRLQLYATAEEFQADLAAGKLDLAFVSPVQALRARRAAGYRPLVRDEAPVRGILVVAADSPFRREEDLAHREVAFIAPWTFCSVSLRASVRKDLKIQPKYVGTVANVYKHVLLGLSAGGGLLDSSLDDAPPEVRARLRILYETPPMAAHAVIAHPRVPREVGERLTAAAIALARSDRALLAPARLATPVEAVYARDYAPLEFMMGDDMYERPPAAPAPPSPRAAAPAKGRRPAR